MGEIKTSWGGGALPRLSSAPSISDGASSDTPGFGWGNLLATGLGIALPGIGGLIGNLGMDLFNVGGSSTKNSYSNNLDVMLDRMPEITRASGYNAAGKVGNEVEPSYAMAKAGLGNTAEGRSSYETQLNLAGRQLSSLDGAIDSANKNAQTLGGSTIRTMTQAARDSGGGLGAIMAIANNIGQQTASNIGQTSANIASQSGDAIGKASAITSAGQEGLMKDLQQQYELNVKPYEMQTTNQNALGNANQLTEQSMSDSAMYQPFAGFSTALAGQGGMYAGQNQANVGAGQMLDIIKKSLGGGR